VLGFRCPLTCAAAVGEVEEPLQALEEAEQTKLVEARSGDDGWVVAFRHPLIRAEPDALTHRMAAAGDGPDPELVALLVERAEG
jgi:hypothetical protein